MTRYSLKYLVKGYVNKYSTKYFDSRKEADEWREKAKKKGTLVIPYTIPVEPRKRK